jgi:hypothetical protein
MQDRQNLLDNERHLESISAYLTDNGATIFNTEYFVPFFTDIPTMILAPSDAALQRSAALSDSSLEQLTTSKEGVDILDNHVSVKPTSKVWPMVTSVNGRLYGKSEQDILALKPRASTIIKTPTITQSLLSTSVLIIDEIILHDDQLANLKMVIASTLQILIDLFDTDPRLIRTKPTQEYRIDPVKWTKWQSLATSQMKKEVRYVQYHFNQWLESLAIGIDALLEDMSLHQCDVYVSTGTSVMKEQSASELWMFYIFQQLMAAKGKIIEPYNDYWAILRRGKTPANCKHLVLIDDFVRSGNHLTQRIVSTPDLLDFMLEKGAVLYILTPIMVVPKIFKRTFSDIVRDVAGEQPETADYIRVINNQTKFLTGIYYDIEAYPYIILDHNGSDKFESEIAGGNFGKSLVMGPLLEGDSVENPYRYPPPLYHLEFGKGTLPKKAFKFRPSKEPGLYEIDMLG